LRVTAAVERFAVAGAFTIARGAKTHVDVIACEIEAGGFVGRGEGTPIYYRGETARGCLAAIRAWAASGGHEDRMALQRELTPGAARNAIDCALWDLAARRSGTPVWRLASLPPPRPALTAWTVSLGQADAMAEAALAASRRGFRLIKLKLAGDGADLARLGAIRAAVPRARLIVDANESWQAPALLPQALALADFGVELIEQPLPHGDDAALEGFRAAVPLCADESCHTTGEVPLVARRYQAVNVKLDKAGGLTAALALIRAAQAAGLEVMLGCMLATSRAIRFALALAPLARWVDLDGPALLARDRPGGLRYEEGRIWPD
jgi:L-alanine-DL-glutamate epimerase-like enolase superfamily enzyme